MDTPKTILVATDFTDIADHAVDHAVELALSLAANVILLHVCEPVQPRLNPSGRGVDMFEIDRTERAARHRLALQARRVNELEVTTLVEVGDPAEEIVRSAARLGADLIVTGTHGRRGLAHVLLGSVAETVLRRAPCPVLIVPATELAA